MADVKILSKTVEYGILMQDKTDGIATAWKALGNDANTNWADPAVPASNFRRIAYDAGSVVFDSAPVIDQLESTGQNGLHDEIAQTIVDGRSGLPTMTFAMPADKFTLAPHLVGALLGTVTENATTPWDKSIVCGGLTGTIDFSTGGAHLHTLSMTDKASVDDGVILEDAIISELNLEWDFNANGIARWIQMSGAWVGSELNFEQTMVGTTVDTTLTPYNRAESYSFTTLTVNSVDWSSMIVRRFSFNVNNNVTSNSKTTLGKAANYDVKPEYTSTFILDYNDTTEKVLNDFQDGTGTNGAPVIVVATIASSTTATLDGGLSIACVKGVLMGNPQIYNDEFLGVELNVKWQANGASTPVTIIQTDTQDWGY